MASSDNMELNFLVDTLKAAAESSRMRILGLLSRGDLTVTDLTSILGQSQPRVSRHLKLLQDAGLVDRYQEGSWAFFRLAEGENERDLVLGLLARIANDDPTTMRDIERLGGVRQKRQDMASGYFRANASSWDQIRSLHVADQAVETGLRDLVGERPFQTMVDLGTGTGRLLELFAPYYQRASGIDMSREMLTVARANLEQAGITHAQVRLGDVYAPPVDRDSADLVTIHQVLHYLDDPALAIHEAARLLRPSGRLLIVDFATHSHEFLREDHAHLRLGFSDRQIEDWLKEAGLELEQNISFAPTNDAKGLTVKLWLARDQRLLIADTIDAAAQREVA